MLPKGKPVNMEKEMAKKRQELAFFPPGIEARALSNRYRLMWALKTTAHSATIVNAGESGLEPDKYPFFTNFFYCSWYFIDIIFMKFAMVRFRFTYKLG
ncbi:hypothetical protein D1007_59423 [Hordeum vulgare]|nr:hypothetical protein D1007_59423 [Hordeum vulgare]